MGFYDRDYYRQTLPRGGFGHFSAWSITTWLIVANVVIFFLDGFLRAHSSNIDSSFLYDEVPETRRQMMFAAMGPLERWGYFSTAKAIYGLQMWRFITFQFLHASPWHLIGNMLGLFFFGPIVEAQFGGRRYLAFYLLCGLSGAASYLLLAAAHVLVLDPQMPLVGASAGIFGLLVAAALISPHVEVFYYYLPITIGMLAVCGMLMAAYSVLANGLNSDGEAAHLGGGVLGFALMKNQHWLNFTARGRRPVPAASGRSRRRPRQYQKDWSKDFNR